MIIWSFWGVQYVHFAIYKKMSSRIMLSLYLMIFVAYYYALNYASIMSWGLLSMPHIHYETNIHLNIHYKTIINVMHSLQCGNYFKVFKSLQIVSMRYYFGLCVFKPRTYAANSIYTLYWVICVIVLVFYLLVCFTVFILLVSFMQYSP